MKSQTHNFRRADTTGRLRRNRVRTKKRTGRSVRGNVVAPNLHRTDIEDIRAPCSGVSVEHVLSFPDIFEFDINVGSADTGNPAGCYRNGGVR
jgi:hypothetical protein